MEILKHFCLWACLVLVGVIFLCSYVESCNEVVCASIVSKCMLTQSCKCDLKNCSCCKECLNCLGKKYYEECCSCVGEWDVNNEILILLNILVHEPGVNLSIKIIYFQRIYGRMSWNWMFYVASSVVSWHWRNWNRFTLAHLVRFFF